MKPKHPKQLNIIEGGRHEWEATDQFREQTRKIIQEITDKYSERLLRERSWITRTIIKLRRTIEIEKRITRLSSDRNLHGVNPLTSF